ncbi:MAG: hypothetical protein U5L10_00765 [Candidatus Moranbacteria bacterium]|nr:hypothetical protein [Candidatus Moranbacteria bacterium]
MVLFFAILPSVVQAHAWWGEGARDTDWILRHGGSLVRYTIRGKASSDAYKARMYLTGAAGAGGGAAETAERGDVIEIEYGSKATFDDAINNLYKVIVFRGSDSEISAEFFARPGEIVDLHFDLYEDKSYQSKTIAYRGDQISLTSESSEYVRPTDLEFSKTKKKPEPKEKEKASPSKKEDSEESAEQQEQEETKDDSKEEDREIEEENEKKAEADKEEDENRGAGKAEVFRSEFEARKEKIESLERGFEEEWNKEKERNRLVYLFRGPSRARIEVLKGKLRGLKSEFSESKKLKELAFDDATKKEAGSLITDTEEKMKQELDRLKKISREASFWERAKSFFAS